MVSLLKKAILFSLLFGIGDAHGQGLQTEKDFIRSYVQVLASPGMYGRGYVKEGRERASAFLQRKFSEFKLKPATRDGVYIQGYSFPVNTFPGKMSLEVNGKELIAGVDYLVDAASAAIRTKEKQVKKIDLDKVADSAALAQLVGSLNGEFVLLLQEVDSFCKRTQIRSRNFSDILPQGCYIIPTRTKLTWTVSRKQNDATIFYVKEDALPRKVKDVNATVDAKFIQQAKNDNVIGYVPGTVKDSFIVFSAHYDHLGMMGENAIFPGASDNASGTSAMLYLASYFAKHPQRYSVLFIAFSGEEAGLMGSDFFVDHPVVPLERIKFLTNVDIMGDATDGVTVVNATEFPRQFELLNSINDKNHYLPVIKSRGKAANSDHYHFSEAGVPAFFIYSNGGKGYYHDIFDKPEEITLANIDGVVKLLIDFAAAIR
jgi:aminopeptidase YwaD